MAESVEIIGELNARGLLSQSSGGDEFAEHLSQSRSLYCGFDPTADSLHIGSLVPLLTLRRFQLAGHQPIALLGGATGLIGDPSFKAQERQLNSADVVEQWVESIGQQVRGFLDFDTGSHAAKVVNNLDWVGGMDLLSFLRDVGKHFSVNAMVQKESVKQRIEREGEGISFTEFTYMILQSYDFAQLNKQFGCSLQIGGSDQWGNITGGIDLTRRLNGESVYGMTMPLVTKADGTKFGKTESGTVWLDSAKTSPYAFYQFWRNTSDADVYKFLRYFTFLSIDEIVEIEAEDAARNGPPRAQQVLAKEVTGLVHGNEGVTAAERIAQALFSGEHQSLAEADYRQLLQDGIPAGRLSRSALGESTLAQVLVEAGVVNSGKQVKDALARGALIINDQVVTSEMNMDCQQCFAVDSAKYGAFYLTRLGKKKYHLFEVVE